MSIINEDKYLKQCRICLENDNENDVISPCLCNGSLLYVHRKCLDYWRTDNANKKSFEYCDICKFKYVIENVIYDKNKLLKYYLLIIRDLTLLILCIQPLILLFIISLKILENENMIKNIYPNSVNGFTPHYLTACLILLSILGFVVVIIALIFSIFDTNHPHPSIFTGNINKEDVLCMCAFLRFLLTILLFVIFLKFTMDYHRNEIWLKQEPYIYIIKDFTEKRKDLQLYKTNQ